MVDNLRDLRPGQLIVGGGRILKIAKAGGVKRESPYDAKGQFVIDMVTLRTVPPGFTGGRLEINNYGSFNVCKLAYGDQEAYHAWLEKSMWYADVGMVAAGEADPIIQLLPAQILKSHKFTKLDLMAYVVAVHGPLHRDEIMRMTAALEGLPWVPTSNTEYFQGFRSERSTLCLGYKERNKKFWILGDEGKERAKRVLDVVGQAPALAAK